MAPSRHSNDDPSSQEEAADAPRQANGQDSTAAGPDGGSASDAQPDSSASSQDSSSAPSCDGGLPDAYGPVPDGGVFCQFVQTDQTTYFDTSQQQAPTGSLTFGVSNSAASDGKVATPIAVVVCSSLV